MTQPAESDQLKSCCAAVYQSDFARMLLGDSFHPGGLRLTQRLGELLELKPGVRVLDVASGKGESAIFLAKTFGCEVVGIDFGADNVAESSARAEQSGVAKLTTFQQDDAESISFPDDSFDAIICECAFCTFPDKPTAASEFARVLRPAGGVAISDLTRSGPLPTELEGLLAWIACIADARPIGDYLAYLSAAGIVCSDTEIHDEALSEMVRDIQGKLMGAELLAKLGKLDISGVDFAEAKGLARAASDAVKSGTLGYAVFVGRLP